MHTQEIRTQKDETREGLRADSAMRDFRSQPVRSLNSPHLTWNPFHRARFVSQHQWISISSRVFCFNTVHSVDLITPKTSINTIYATIRQTNDRPIKLSVEQAIQADCLWLYAQPAMEWLEKIKQ